MLKLKQETKKRRKEEKGITLIALVVTIIVLLILSAIALSMLTGENSILKRSTQAKKVTDEAEFKEQLQLAVMASYDTFGRLNPDTLKSNIQKDIAGVNVSDGGDSEDDILTASLNGMSYTVDKNGNVVAREGVVLNKSKIEDLQIITNGSNTTYGEETLTVTLVNVSGNITWSTNNSSVIEVTPSADGKSATIKAKQAGTATVTVACSGKTAQCEVKVTSVVAITSITSITASPSKNTIELGESITLTANVNSGATEEVKWECASDAITIEKQTSNTAKVTGVKKGENIVITAKNSSGTASKTYTLKVQISIDDYVSYNVTYKDIYTNNDYGQNNGWRLLNKKDNGNGTYDIDIISAGIPAGLYYHYNYIKNSDFAYDGTLDSNLNETAEGTQGKWAANGVQRNAFATKFYASGSNSNNNMYASAGLYYNFKYITFKAETGMNSYSNSHYNYGYYTNINDKTSEDLSGKEFITPKTALNSGTITGVRSVSLADIYSDFTNSDKDGDNVKVSDSKYTITEYTIPATATTDKVQGMFKLDTYTPDKHTSGYYWLASPCSISEGGILAVDYTGHIYEYSDYTSSVYRGIRPIVSISGVKMSYDENKGLWSITN